MTENSEFRAAGKAHNSTGNPAVEGDSQYVEGDYGEAGVVGDEARAETKGQYSAGDYGDAGTVESPAGTEKGAYAEGDYGEAGTAGEDEPAAQAGAYAEGNYGEAGTAQERTTADDLKDDLADGQVNAPKKDDGGAAAGG